MSRVDVVIPCYNYAHFLRQCVASALDQSDVDVRVLIIDDCSPDDTEVIGRHLAGQDNRIEFRRHPNNKGHIATYNEGLLEWASAEYSILLSADDVLAPGALVRATQVMERHPNVGMIYGMAKNIWNEESSPIHEENVSLEYRVVSSSEFLKHSFVMGNAVCTPTAVVRTELQQKLGGYRVELPHTGDMEMWMRFAANADVGVLKAVQAYYRMHDGNMSHKYYKQILGDQQEVMRACEEIFAQWGNKFPACGYWRELMLQRISISCCWLASCAFDNGDIDTYQTCITFAEKIYPRIYNTKVWYKLRAKKIIGQAVWQKIRPAWEQLRELRKTLSGRKTTLPIKSDKLIGWWPEPADF